MDPFKYVLKLLLLSVERTACTGYFREPWKITRSNTRCLYTSHDEARCFMQILHHMEAAFTNNPRRGHGEGRISHRHVCRHQAALSTSSKKTLLSAAQPRISAFADNAALQASARPPASARWTPEVLASTATPNARQQLRARTTSDREGGPLLLGRTREEGGPMRKELPINKQNEKEEGNYTTFASSTHSAAARSPALATAAEIEGKSTRTTSGLWVPAAEGQIE
ncbi:hypothetical protein Efla_000453 [Eimeria flavescens]